MVNKSESNINSVNQTEVVSFDDTVTRIINSDTETGNYENSDDTFSIEELSGKISQPDWSKLEGSFSDLNVIGMGGMGTVFAAKDSLFYRNVALKIMRSELRGQEKNINSFIREARITAQIDHPNIVPVYNLGIFQELGPYFSMKKIEGITLAEILKKIETGDRIFEKEYSLRRRLEIFISICNGVAFAHSKGVMHCDLKPGNIMVGNYGEVFIMDWGMAVYRSDKDLSSGNRKINLGTDEIEKEVHTTDKNAVVKGTPAFMAPEQIFGKKDAIDEQTDVYALGVILYAILTCTQSPFPAGLAAEEIFDRALAGNFLPPRKRAGKRRISNELEVVCLKAMSPYKHERYKDVMSLKQDIRNILDMHPIEVYNSPILNFIKYCRRHPMIPTALLGAFITLAVFYSYFSFSNMINAASLHRMLQVNLEEISPQYIHIRSVLKREKDIKEFDGYDPDFTENKEFEIKNSGIKLDIACNRVIDTLDKLNDIAVGEKYLSAVKTALDFCVNYSILTHNDENIRKIQAMDTGLVYEAYKDILRSNPKLRRQLQLLSINSGELHFETSDDSLQIFISKQIDQDSVSGVKSEKSENENAVSELMLKKGPFRITMKSGEYSLLISDKDERNVTIPVLINAGENVEIKFEFPENIPPDTIYIHEGHFYTNITNHYSHGEDAYSDSYFLLDREVTIGEYLEFFKTLKNGKMRNLCNPDLLYDEGGNFSVKKLFDDNYNILAPYKENMPLVGISVEGANAFCEYMSKKLKMKCRLPYFAELEKAARGTGRRLFVWGNRFNAEYALLAVNPEIEHYPNGAPPKSFAHDYSLYGAYDLTGNVRELVRLRKNIDHYALFGGSYRNTASYAKCGTLSRFTENRIDVGMRYVIEIPKQKNKKTDSDKK